MLLVIGEVTAALKLKNPAVSELVQSCFMIRGQFFLFIFF